MMLAFSFFVGLGACQSRSDSGLPVVTLRLEKYKVRAEVASTPAEQTAGLMFRTHLGEDDGMLFVFPDLAFRTFWMKNTYVPLTVAFLDADGNIINLEDMQPQTEDLHPSFRPAKYALEMRRGWFAGRGLGPGTRVEGLDKVVISGPREL